MFSRYTLLAVALAASVANACTACDLVPVAITGSSAKTGDLVLDFGEADNPQQPTAWQGPLKISASPGRSCTVSEDVAIIEQPVLVGKALMYVPTYSGSENRLYAVDTKTCRVLWKSSEYTGRTRYQHGKLTIGGRPMSLRNNCLP